MALTAEDIQNVSFSIDRKGYDVDEVDVFLERVADEVDSMNKTIASLEEQLEAARNAVPAMGVVPADSGEFSPEANARIAELEDAIAKLEVQLSEKSANDNAISQALIVAQRSADEIVSNARAEASNIVKDADEEADRIIGKAESDRLKIAEAIRALENDRSDVRAEYREMLANFMADAQRKLAEIDGDSRRAAASSQARADAMSGYSPASMPEYTPAGASAVPAQTPASAQPVSNYVDKDFSGYGDADDAFVFDID